MDVPVGMPVIKVLMVKNGIFIGHAVAGDPLVNDFLQAVGTGMDRPGHMLWKRDGRSHVQLREVGGVNQSHIFVTDRIINLPQGHPLDQALRFKIHFPDIDPSTNLIGKCSQAGFINRTCLYIYLLSLQVQLVTDQRSVLLLSLYKDLSGLKKWFSKSYILFSAGGNRQIHGNQIHLSFLQITEIPSKIVTHTHLQGKVHMIGQFLQHLILKSQGLTTIEKIRD